MLSGRKFPALDEDLKLSWPPRLAAEETSALPSACDTLKAHILNSMHTHDDQGLTCHAGAQLR